MMESFRVCGSKLRGGRCLIIVGTEGALIFLSQSDKVLCQSDRPRNRMAHPGRRIAEVDYNDPTSAAVARS
jgi:hypothetical protein